MITYRSSIISSTVQLSEDGEKVHLVISGRLEGFGRRLVAFRDGGLSQQVVVVPVYRPNILLVNRVS